MRTPRRTSGRSSRPFGLAVVDEAYQASGPVFAAVAAACPRLLLVGDPGQLKPFSTDPYACRAPRVGGGSHAVGGRDGRRQLRRHHHQVPHANHPSASGTCRVGRPSLLSRPSVRRLGAAPDADRGPLRRACRSSARLVQSALADGWRHVRLPPDPSRDDADPEMSAAVADVAVAAVAGAHRLASRGDSWAVVTSRRRQHRCSGGARTTSVSWSRPRLTDRLGDAPRPVVGTANSLQGLEFDLTVVWYPLAGQSSFDDFRGDPARLAVMLTRHRHGCVLVGRASDADIFEKDVPPLGELNMAFVDPITRGWLTHLAVLRQLAPYRVDVRGDAAVDG